MKEKLKQVIVHLRLPFGIFLMPVFLFTVSNVMENVQWQSALLLFFIFHVLVYPSSNAYNSYMDEDKGSIGGIENPPPTPKVILLVSLAFDSLALLLSLTFFDEIVAALILVYIIMSRLYSYRKIRLKQYAVLSFIIVGLVQGCVVYLTTYWALSPATFSIEFFPSAITFLLVTAGYPISQIYQHKQDKEDGVTTISMKLGINNTFYFSGALFGVLLFLLATTHYNYFENSLVLYFLLFALSPSMVFFFIWQIKTAKNKENANFKNTMRMNLLGALGFNLYFAAILLFF